MKRILLLFTLSLCTYAQTTLDRACDNLIDRTQVGVKVNKPILKVDQDKLYMSSRFGDIKSFDLKTNQLIQEFSINEKINDFTVTSETIWAITNHSLLKIDIESGDILKEFPTSLEAVKSTKYEVAKAMTQKDHLLYIANGERSIALFDPQLEKIVNEKRLELPQENAQRSWATGISIAQDYLYLGIDNITYNFSTKKRAFEGIAIYNRFTLERVHIVSVRQNLEAYHMPRLFTYKNSIISNNLFLYFFNDAQKLLKQKKITPQRRMYQFSAGKPFGTLTPYGDHFIGCFNSESRSRATFARQEI